MQCSLCHTHNEPEAIVCQTCGAPLGSGAPDADALAPGSSLQDGHYTLGPMLGQGGFGITYRGRDEQLGRAVAIKEFFPFGSRRRDGNVVPAGLLRPADYATARAKFLEEARRLARFEHPGIVHVYTCFEAHDTAYMVMELLEGRSLLQLVEQKGALNQTEALTIIRQGGAALQEVHRAGLLHRDIKPDNIIVCRSSNAESETESGRVVLIDFGTAREFASGVTRHMTTTLTPGYAPLEQYGVHANLGTFTDIYSLGATLYWLLTGMMPVPATDRAAGVDLRPPHHVNSAVSPAISLAIVQAMAVKVDERPQSVSEFLELLQDEPVQDTSTRDAQVAVLQSLQSLRDATAQPEYGAALQKSSATAPPIPSYLPFAHLNDTTVRVITPAPHWPQHCVCCNGPAETTLRIIYPASGQITKDTRTWEVPYCWDCVRHVSLAGERAETFPAEVGAMTVIGLLAGIFFANEFSSLFPLLFWIGGSVGGGSWWTQRKQRRAQSLLKSNCCTPHLAVSVTYEAFNHVYTFEFQNPVYAGAFRQLNAPGRK